MHAMKCNLSNYSKFSYRYLGEMHYLGEFLDFSKNHGVTVLIQPCLVAYRYRQENSAATTFIAPASTCIPTGNDHQASSFAFNLSSWCCSGTRSSSVFENSIRFLIFVRNFTSCRLAMTIAVALVMGGRHTNVRWKPEKDVYTFGVQGFCSFHFESCSQFEIVSSLQSVQRRIPAAFINFDKAYLLNH
jgi:hypothetical protein